MEATLLVELLTEELPPKSLRKLSDSFADQVTSEIVKHRLKDRTPAKQVFATPRRIAVIVEDVRDTGLDSENSVEGPISSNTKAVEGFARKHKVPPETLERRQTEKGEIVVANFTVPGVKLDSVLAGIVEQSLKKLPIPKLMRWGSGEAQFVRPAHRLTMIHGTRVVPGAVLGLESSNRTRGHRFMHKDEQEHEIVLDSADEYEKKLILNMVVPNFAARRDMIEKQLLIEANKNAAQLGEHGDLLDEVTALVEHPTVYVGGFDSAFLEVPQECLILTMEKNQKYFPLFDAQGKLLPKFLIVSNMRLADPAHVVRGNERVVRPRLEDARFFFLQDKKVPLQERVPLLDKVIHHNKLGTQLDRVKRIQSLAGHIAQQLRSDKMLAEHAAWLCKADLLTGMVGEFPELQGIMGRYYAEHDGEPSEVAEAIDQHYRPRFAGDQLPEHVVASAVALADKVDTLVGIFGIGLLPSGDRDPFGLRRHALGVLRILCEQRLPIDLTSLLRWAHDNYPEGKLKESHPHNGIEVPNYLEVDFFVKERAKGYLRDQGFEAMEIEAVLDLGPMPAQYKSRLEAARRFLTLPEAAGLAEADKRIRNIINKSAASSVVQVTNESKFESDAERQLFRTTRVLRKQVDELLEGENFTDALLLTAQVHAPVTTFFDKVMVNVEDEAVRINRFALLHEVSNLTNRVANISKLAA